MQEHISSDWEVVCAKAQTQTVNIHLKFLQYNWLMNT